MYTCRLNFLFYFQVKFLPVHSSNHHQVELCYLYTTQWCDKVFFPSDDWRQVSEGGGGRNTRESGDSSGTAINKAK